MSDAVNKTEEWVLGPDNTPFFTTTVRSLLHVRPLLTPSGHLLP